MSIRFLCLAAAVAWFAFSTKPGFADHRESVHRILHGRHACLPCGAKPHYVVIGSDEKINALHAQLAEICGDSKAPDTWRQSVIDLGVNFRDEAVIALYEVIGTGGTASLAIAGPEDGILKAAIKWHTGPPPHPPIATAACITFAVQKSAVRRVDILPGGVLNKDRSERSLVVPASQTY